MLRIFRQAREVIVWLGAATASTTYAISFAKQAERLLPHGTMLASGVPSSAREIRASRSPEVSVVKHFWKQFAKCSQETLSWYQAGLEDLLSRPWFRRIWVIQEVTASTRVNVHVGEYFLEWQLFVNLDLCWFALHYDLIARSSSPPYIKPLVLRSFDVELNTPLDSLQRIKERRRYTQEGDVPGNRMLRLLARTRYASATDPRDRIYGLLGLLGNLLP